MRDITYVFKVMVKTSAGEIVYEEHKVLEKASAFGEAFASGRVVRYYENLKNTGKIKDYRIIEE